jgi:hypothetical protein
VFARKQRGKMSREEGVEVGGVGRSSGAHERSLFSLFTGKPTRSPVEPNALRCRRTGLIPLKILKTGEKSPVLGL